jgi:hypothetical protein
MEVSPYCESLEPFDRAIAGQGKTFVLKTKQMERFG